MPMLLVAHLLFLQRTDQRKKQKSYQANAQRHRTQVIGQMNHQIADPKANASIFLFLPSRTQTDFSKFTRKEIKHVQKLLNERSQKTLDWSTPKEKFKELLLR